MAEPPTRPVESPGAPQAALDDLDRELLRLLEADGRASYADLGRAIGLSAAGARLRVLRLQAMNAVRIVAVSDPAVWGLRSRAYIGVTVTRDARMVADDLRSLPGVRSIALVSGRFELLVDVVAEGPADLLRVVNDGIRAVGGVAHAEALTVHDPMPGPLGS